MAQFEPRLQQLPDKVVEALKAGNAVLAIKLLRELKGIGLKEARDLLVAVRDGMPAAGKPAARNEPRPDAIAPARPTANVSRRPTGLAPGEVPHTDGVLWRVLVGIALTLLAYWFLREG